MTELRCGQVAVHEVDVANQRRIVESRVDNVGRAAANQCAIAVRTAERLRLSKASGDRWGFERADGAGQRVKDAHLEPFAPLGREVFERRPEGELRQAFGLALAADDR